MHASKNEPSPATKKKFIFPEKKNNREESRTIGCFLGVGTRIKRKF